MTLNLRPYLIALALLMAWPASITIADSQLAPPPEPASLCVWHDPGLAAYGADGALFQAVQAGKTSFLYQVASDADAASVPECLATNPTPCQADAAAGYAVLATQLLCFTPTAPYPAAPFDAGCLLDAVAGTPCQGAQPRRACNLDSNDEDLLDCLSLEHYVINPPCQSIDECVPQNFCIGTVAGKNCKVLDPCTTPKTATVCHLLPCNVS